MAASERNHEASDRRDNGSAGRDGATTPPATPPSLEDLVAELQAENKWLRYQLAIRLFPPETAPPFDPSEYHIVAPEKMLADLRSVGLE